MNAPDRIPADYQAEAKTLVEWLFEQVVICRIHTPDLVGKMQKLEDSAALIDSYRAGLVLVDPHPLMRAELVRWVSVDDAMPERDNIVLLWRDGDDSPWIGYLDGHRWRHADGFHVPKSSVTHWAKMPAGPATPAHLLEEPAA